MKDDRLKKLAEKYPDKLKFGKEDELKDVELDESGLIDEGFRKIDIEIVDLQLLLRFGRIQLADHGVELVLRKTADDDEILKIKRVIRNNPTSGKIQLPVKWVNRRVAVLLLGELGE